MKTKLKYLLKELSDKEKDELWLELSDPARRNSIQKSIELVGLNELSEVIEQRYATWGQMQGLSTGFQGLNDLTSGLVPGELTIVAGLTSHGKTTLAVNMCYKQATMKTKTLFVTLEMTHAELGSRFRHIHGKPVDDLDVLFQKNDELGWLDIDPLIGAAVKRGVEIVFIDHLHYFTRELDNVADDLGRITKEMKKNAIRHNIPIILISHVRKQGGKEKPSMEDLRGSSYIAQDADIVLMVHRPTDENNTMVVEVQKNRNRGFNPEKNAVKFMFDGVKLDEGWI